MSLSAAVLLAENCKRTMKFIEEKAEATEERIAMMLDRSFGELSTKILKVNVWTEGFEAALNYYEAVVVAAHEEALLSRIKNDKGSLTDSTQSTVARKPEISAVKCVESATDVAASQNADDVDELTMKSVAIWEEDGPIDVLILQGSKKLRFNNEDVSVRIGLVWDYDCTVLLVLCLPKRDAVCGKASFYSNILVGLELEGPNGEPVHVEFVIESPHGTCSFSTTASDEEHLQCNQATYCNQVFGNEGELDAFKKCLRRSIDKGATAYYLTVRLEMIPLKSESTEGSVLNDERDQSSAVSENTVSITAAAKLPATSTQSMEERPSNSDIDSPRQPVLVLPRFARIRGSASAFPDTGENMVEDNLLSKLSKSARVAYESWWTGDGLDFWADNVEVTAELLHLAHQLSLPKLTQDVIRILETFPDEKFTPELAADVLAAAAMYNFHSSPDLLRRAGRLVLGQRSFKGL